MVVDDKLWEKYENFMRNEGVTNSRISKLKTMYNMAKRGLKISFEDVDRDHMEKFITRLNRNQFKSLKGEPLAGWTKSDLKKFIKHFYRWLKGDNEFYPKEVSWIKTKISKDEKAKEKPIISLDELHQFANSFRNPIYKIMALMLFDSGFRISELLSVKREDLQWDKFQEGQSCFWVSCNESKTETRRIPIPLFTEDIQLFVNSSYFKTLNDDERIFKQSYSLINHTFKKRSLKMFGDKKKITPHVLRHSSATYYSREYDGNMNLIAGRYGWEYNSDQLKTYIRKSGAYQRAGAKKVYENEIVKLREELSKVNNMVNKIVNDPIILEKLLIKARGGER